MNTGETGRCGAVRTPGGELDGVCGACPSCVAPETCIGRSEASHAEEAAACGLADYQIIDVTYLLAVDNDTSFTGSFVVQNVGEADGALAFSAEVFVSDDETLDDGDIALLDPPASVDPVVADTSSPIEFEGTWPGSGSEWYLIIRIADGMNVDATPQDNILVHGPVYARTEQIVVAVDTNVTLLSEAGGVDGSWTRHSLPGMFVSGNDVATDGEGRWVTVHNTAWIFVSDDARTWTAATFPRAGEGYLQTLADVDYCNGRWAIAGGTSLNPVNDGVAYYSDDGEEFLLGTGELDTVRRALECNPDAGIWIAIAGASALRSDDNAATWVAQGALPASMRDLAFAGDAWVAVGGSGVPTIARTTDPGIGVDWTRIDAPTAEDLSAVATDGGSTFVAVGPGGAVARSADGGLTWDDVSLSESVALTAIAWLPRSARFAVGDAAGNVRFSDDGGSTWTPPIATGSVETIRGIAGGP